MPKKRKKPKGLQREDRGRLLLLTYFFPPTAGGGVFRPLAMVKYLSRMGWRITVLTATTPRHYPVDPELEQQIPDGVEVIRIPVVWEGGLIRRVLGKLSLDWIPRHLVTPDERVFWAEKASNRMRKFIREGSFDCLYTTGPPFSILLAGLWAKRQKSIPWIAEFRDPWTIAPYQSLPNAHHRRFANDTERDLMKLADAIVMVTPTFTRMMREKYPESASKVHCVPNGFDSEDFKGLIGEEKRNDRFTVVVSGTVFGRYNIDDFLLGLEELKTSDKSFDRLRVSVQGLSDYRLNRRLLESGLNQVCESKGFVAHSRNIRDLVDADLLVLTLSPVPNAEGHIPSRAYEYLASGTPILAVCPDGDLADLLGPFPQVTRVAAGDIKGVANALMEAVKRREDGTEPPKPDPGALSALRRKVRAAEMDAILQGMLDMEEGAA